MSHPVLADRSKLAAVCIDTGSVVVDARPAWRYFVQSGSARPPDDQSGRNARYARKRAPSPGLPGKGSRR